MTDVSQPSEAEVEAFANGFGILRPSQEDLVRIKCGLTAAAQVRAGADEPMSEFDIAQGEAYTAAVYALNRYRHAFHGRPVRDLDEADLAWRSRHEKLEKLVGIKPRTMLTEPDSGPSVLGIKRGEE